MERQVQPQEISSITDRIMFLGKKAVLIMVVSLWVFGSKKRNPDKEFFYKELLFRQSGIPASRKIDRVFKSYLGIRYLPDAGESHQFIVITSSTLEMMKYMVLPKLESILYNYSDIFQTRQDGKLYINNPNHMYSIRFDVNDSSTLIFEPSITKNVWTENIEPCIDIYFNGTKLKTSPTFPEVLAFMRIIRLFSIESYGANMINNLDIDYGTNTVQTSRSSSFETTETVNIFNKKGVTNVSGFVNNLNLLKDKEEN